MSLCVCRQRWCAFDENAGFLSRYEVLRRQSRSATAQPVSAGSKCHHDISCRSFGLITIACGIIAMEMMRGRLLQNRSLTVTPDIVQRALRRILLASDMAQSKPRDTQPSPD